MISIDYISKNYGAVKALQDVSFAVRKGELFGLIGPDGAGKTTLFRSLVTLLLPDSGTMTFDGHDVVKDYRYVRRNVGYMPGTFSLYQDLTVRENLEFFASVFQTTVEANYDLIKDIYVMLEPFEKRRTGALSGGMKQKLALSCALIHTPRLLILDEPTFGVDPVSRMELWNILHELNAGGMSIVVSTSYMDEAEQCDRVALMHTGRIMQCDRPQALIDGFPAKLYRITGSDLGAVRDFLKAQTGLRGIQIFGGEIHLMSDSAIAASTFTDWKRKCPSLQGWEAISPVMEDVFLEQMHDN